MMSDLKSDVLREWRESARYWQQHAATIRRMFAPVTDALVQDAGIVEGYSVLDVAGGSGEPSLTIAETVRSEEHTSELQSRLHLVCRLLLEKKKKKNNAN